MPQVVLKTVAKTLENTKTLVQFQSQSNLAKMTTQELLK